MQNHPGLYNLKAPGNISSSPQRRKDIIYVCVGTKGKAEETMA